MAEYFKSIKDSKNINSMVPLFPRRKSYLTNLISAIVLIALVYITLCSSNASKLYINLIGISFRQMKGLMFVILYTIIMDTVKLYIIKSFYWLSW